jgi:hypothetical protein
MHKCTDQFGVMQHFTEVPMSHTDIRALVEHYIDAYNRKNIDDMLMNVHPQVEFMNISAGVVNASTKGVAELRALAQQSLSLFSERHQKIESFELQGSLAIATIAFRAVVAADLPNGLKKGQVLNLSGRSDFEFQDGAISKITDIS